MSLRGITKRFGTVAAAEDVSFDVFGGEVVGFLGPNGAGKTTTMRILACYIAPDSGSATVAGHDIRDEALEVRRRIGYLPESAPLYLDLSVSEHLSFIAELRGIRGREAVARIGRMIDVCGLADVVHRDVGELSKGYRQRVGLACTLVHDPDVLILDEPTTGLDPSQIVEVRELVKRIGREKTVILSTHILPEVEAVADRVVIIADGRIRASGTPDQLSRAAAGSRALRVSLRAPEARALEALSALAQDGDARKMSDDADGFATYRVAGGDLASLSDAVYELAREQDWPLRALSQESAGLESVFLRLAMRDPVDEGDGAGARGFPTARREEDGRP
ncbi:MAG: ATP-binding cassette domain-containing protein [Candidatus Eisenbacteria bacterium]|nr:ATP-binding cassette domain-containing protein [Candidatus Eisenbacteria bacterium]